MRREIAPNPVRAADSVLYANHWPRLLLLECRIGMQQ